MSTSNILRLICTNCSSALLYQHEYLLSWLKCELCGFCIEIEENNKRYDNEV